jgi:hypothetical protein
MMYADDSRRALRQSEVKLSKADGLEMMQSDQLLHVHQDRSADIRARIAEECVSNIECNNPE